MSGGGSEEETLEYTPTWVVAGVCTVIVAISLGVERLLHFLGNYLKKKHQKPLYEALQKVKEELMLLGFISLLLTVFQGAISKFCIPEDVANSMLPCKRHEAASTDGEHSNATTKTSHFQKSFTSVAGTARHLLAEESSAGYCSKKNKVPLLSTEALHHLHIFIFVLAIVHVTFCLLTVIFGGARIRQWKHWEDSIAKQKLDSEEVLKKKVTHVDQHTFIREHFLGIGKDSVILGWMHCFFKQFHASVTKSDYVTLRLGFIMTHCRGNPKFNFHKYMIRALEDDFKRVVGISWYLWIFVVIFLLLNVNGWHTYFWIAFIPFILLLAVGTKLEHVITQLAHEVAEKHAAIEGELVVQPSDEHFWFNRPYIVLFLIHFILFQNSFEIAFFFWIWVQYGFDSCIMGQVRYIVPRLVIGVFIQVLCSYSTLPLYAIVTQMGTFFKKSIFDEHVQVGLVGWAEKVKRKKGLRAAAGEGSTQASSHAGIQLGRVMRNAAATEEVLPSDGSK
ncbi:MLO-like protein 1 [Pistacia vera]|uniref:MLO-like protein 1 n=1 Tax=Pistacia vera TaxID=55513 RepID=UPI001263C021|nr:MLO-like protein 1 [Pistacia vera]